MVSLYWYFEPELKYSYEAYTYDFCCQYNCNSAVAQFIIRCLLSMKIGLGEVRLSRISSPIYYNNSMNLEFLWPKFQYILTQIAINIIVIWRLQKCDSDITTDRNHSYRDFCHWNPIRYGTIVNFVVLKFAIMNFKNSLKNYVFLQSISILKESIRCVVYTTRVGHLMYMDGKNVNPGLTKCAFSNDFHLSLVTSVSSKMFSIIIIQFHFLWLWQQIKIISW